MLGAVLGGVVLAALGENHAGVFDVVLGEDGEYPGARLRCGRMGQGGDKPIRLSRHALEQCRERGTDAGEVERAIRAGTREPVRSGRWQYRYNLQFDGAWNGRRYTIKQVAPVVVEEPGGFVVVTVYTFYF